MSDAQEPEPMPTPMPMPNSSPNPSPNSLPNSSPNPSPQPPTRRVPRSLAAAVTHVVLYGVCSWAFAASTRHGGLLTPEGAPERGLLALGLVVLLLRLGVLFVLLPVVAYRLVLRLATRRRSSRWWSRP